MKEDDRNSVLQGVNRAVVYYNPQYDITNYILAKLNEGYNVPPAAPGANQPAGTNATRPQIPGQRQQ